MANRSLPDYTEVFVLISVENQSDLPELVHLQTLTWDCDSPLIKQNCFGKIQSSVEFCKNSQQYLSSK